MPEIFFDMDNYLNPLTEAIRNAANPVEAEKHSKYLKNKFVCLGVKTPAKNDILKIHFAKFGKPEKSKMNAYVRFLYDMPEREFHHIAINLYEKIAKKLEIDDVEIIEYMIVTNSWWDSVDTVLRLHRVYFALFPEQIRPVTERWIESDNIWLKRSALLFQLHLRKKTDEKLLFDYIQRVHDEKEFFIQKAIGWALRQYSRENPKSVEKFVHENNLSPLARREALRLME